MDLSGTTVPAEGRGSLHGATGAWPIDEHSLALLSHRLLLVCCLTLGALWEGATCAGVRCWVLHHHHYSTGCYLECDTNQ